MELEKRVIMRLSVKDHQKLSDMANKEKRTLSGFLRKLIKDEYGRQSDKTDTITGPDSTSA